MRGAAAATRRRAAPATRRRRDEPLRALHPPAGRDDAADPRHRARRACSRSSCCRSSPLPQVDFPTISVQAPAARRQPGDHGDQRRHAARAPSRPDRRRHRDDLVELGRLRRASPCSSASTATSTAPRATCRRRSTPRAPTCRPTLRSNPTYRKVNPADAPILILALTSTTLHAAARSTTPPPPCCSRSCRRSTGVGEVDRRRQLAAGGARRAQPAARCSSTASAWRTCAPRSPPPTPTRPKGAIEDGDAALPDLHQRPGDARPPTTAPLVVAYRNGAAVRLSRRRRGRRRGRGPAQPRPRQRQARRAGDRVSASPAPTSSTPSTASRRCCRSCRPSLPADIDMHVADRPHDHHPRLAARRRAHAGDRRSCW